MDEFLKMDIFFVVATVATIVLTVLGALVLLSVLRILKRVEEISAMVSEEGKELRAEFKEKGFMVGLIRYLFKRH